MSRPAHTLSWTADEFLAWERDQSLAHEWDGHRVVTMTGGRRRHARVIRNLRNALERQLPPGCEVYTEGFKLRAGQSIRYPDVLLICTSERDLGLDADVAEEAAFVAEVLSPSSVHEDRVAKVEDYAHVPGLEAYLIVDPAQRNVTLYRHENSQLVPAPPSELTGDAVRLFGDLFVRLDDVYAGVLENE